MAATATPTATGKAKYRFRVRSGSYWKPEPLIDPDTKQPLKDAAGKVVTRDVIYGPGREAGDIVETDVDLARRFNTPVSKMYELLDNNDNPIVGQLAEAESRATAADERYRRALAAMNQRELLDHAAAEGVDLRGETTKEKVRTLLLRAAGMEPAPGGD